LEAMGVGCPVISSDKTSLPEVYGEAALYFKPDSSKELVGKIEQIMKDENLKAAQVKKGFEQVKKYSWKKLAEETLEVYKEVNN
ncbi:MAG TPA: glycosyltransferase, partial [Candidatus Saccharimonadales bacterium]|nr:glycosyltransferase [Candidatus Saccharimonadales bacterium]